MRYKPAGISGQAFECYERYTARFVTLSRRAAFVLHGLFNA